MAKIPRPGPQDGDAPAEPPMGDDAVGYGRPPESGRIKHGEVRNPFGRSGKPKSRDDPFEKAMSRPAKFNLDGTNENGVVADAIYLRLAAKAMKGETGAIAIVVKEQMARRNHVPAPKPPTPEDVAAAAEAAKLREEMTKELFDLLDGSAQWKLQGLVGSGAQGSGLAKWVREALGDYRERLGLSRSPGPNENWRPPSIVDDDQ